MVVRPAPKTGPPCMRLGRLRRAVIGRLPTASRDCYASRRLEPHGEIHGPCRPLLSSSIAPQVGIELNIERARSMEDIVNDLGHRVGSDSLGLIGAECSEDLDTLEQPSPTQFP